MFAQVQFPKLALAEAAQHFAAEAALRLELAPEGLVSVPLIHAALEAALAGGKVVERIHGGTVSQLRVNLQPQFLEPVLHFLEVEVQRAEFL